MQCRKPAARALSGGEAHWQGMLSRAAHAERKSAGYVTGFHGNRGTDPANYHRHQDTGDPGPPRPASVGHPGPIPAGPPSAVLPIRGNLPAPVSRRRASLGPEPADTFGGRRRVRRMTWPRTRWAADADLVIDDLGSTADCKTPVTWPGTSEGSKSGRLRAPAWTWALPLPKPHPCSSCRMLVLMKHSAEPVASSYIEAGDLARGHERHGQWLERTGVGDALMRSVPVAGLLELPQGAQQVGLVPDQRAVQELAPAGLHPPLHDRVHPRHPDPAEYSFDASVSEDGIEQARELPVPVPDQEPCPAAGILQVHHKIPGSLRRPGRRRVGGGAQDPDSPAGVLDHREHVQPRPGQGDRLEEVTGQQALGLGTQEIGPRGGTALGRRVDPGVVQDLPDGGSGDLYPEHQQLAVYPAIPPPGILADQPQHQDADRAHGARPTGVPGPGPAGVSARDHIAVPAEHGIWAHHQVQSVEHVSREPVQQRRQQRPITRGESHPARTELPLQDRELVAQREDLCVFVPVAHRQQPQQWLGHADPETTLIYAVSRELHQTGEGTADL